jgi:transmembrane sensor
VLVDRRAPRPKSAATAIAAWTRRGVVLAAAAAIVVVVIFAWRRVFPSSSVATVATVATVAPVAAPSTSSSPIASASMTPTGEQVMGLADGSRAILVEDAGLTVDEQKPELVRIRQQRGTVVYDVRPDPKREFTVHAANHTVRVRGTIFTIAMSIDAVEVNVTQGRVEVDGGSGSLRILSTGESVRTPIVAAAPTLPSSSDQSAAKSPHTSGQQAASDLQAKADIARVEGRLDEAATALETLVSIHPRDPRVPNALFTLGRIEHQRHREAAAAKAFERCLHAAPGGALAEDALAEAANSWSLAGNPAAARRHASNYLARYPNGSQAKRMKAIVGQ